MTETHNRARQQAEIAFAQAQSQFLSRETAAEEFDAAVQARQEKTLRLKTARMEREDRARVTAALPSKRDTKT